MNDKADTTGTGPLLLSAAMLAKKLGVSERHVYKLRSDGRIPRSGKLGASVRWSAAEIAAQTVGMLVRLKVMSDSSPYIFVPRPRLRHLDSLSQMGKLHSNYQLVASVSLVFNRIQKAAAKQLKDANWRQGCFHDLRKSFATRSAAAGVPMRELQAHLGHACITTTAEYYTDVERSAADRLRAVFAASA